MKFRYFLAPETEMADLLPKAQVCSFCGIKARVFKCQIGAVTGEKSVRGCFECLKKGEFGFFHETEFGYIDESGLHPFFDDGEKLRVFIANSNGEIVEDGIPNPAISKAASISEESIAELRKTPSFSTWQDTDWKVHCSDFMAYIGYWQPLDFIKHAGDGAGRKLFFEIAEREFYELWDSDEVIESGWDGGYVMFRCLHCGELRGVYDFS